MIVPSPLVHYGAGLRGSICGKVGARKETTRPGLVTCGECAKIIRNRPK